VVVTGGLSKVSLEALVDALFVTGDFDVNPAKNL
jgi:hypothetical protein